MAVPEEQTIAQEKIDSWRASEFERMGFDPHDVELLVKADVSAHDAWHLVRRGCDHTTALLILL